MAHPASNFKNVCSSVKCPSLQQCRHPAQTIEVFGTIGVTVEGPGSSSRGAAGQCHTIGFGGACEHMAVTGEIPVTLVTAVVTLGDRTMRVERTTPV